MKLRANQVKMTTVNGKADKVMAGGNVVMDSPKTGTATGDSGVYAVVARTVVMTGAATRAIENMASVKSLIANLLMHPLLLTS